MITATSRCATWDSSCASTPSSSAGSSRRSSPVVTQIAAWSALRPVAKAFGISMSATATTGFGMSAVAQSRSITPCSWGYSSRSTTRPCIAYSAIRSENQYCAPSSAAAITTTSTQDFSSTISAVTNPTYSSPSRNSVMPIRAVSRRSGWKRLCIAITSKSGTRPDSSVHPGISTNGSGSALHQARNDKVLPCPRGSDRTSPSAVRLYASIRRSATGVDHTS